MQGEVFPPLILGIAVSRTKTAFSQVFLPTLNVDQSEQAQKSKSNNHCSVNAVVIQEPESYKKPLKEGRSGDTRNSSWNREILMKAP